MKKTSWDRAKLIGPRRAPFRPLGKSYPEVLLCRFAEGTFERIDVVKGALNRTAFIREAVNREIVRREKQDSER